MLLLKLLIRALFISTVPLAIYCLPQEQEDHDQLQHQHLQRLALLLPTQQPSHLTTSHQASFGENTNHLGSGTAVPVTPEQQAEAAARQQQQHLQLQQQQQQQQQQHQQQDHHQQQYQQQAGVAQVNQAHPQSSSQSQPAVSQPQQAQQSTQQQQTAPSQGLPTQTQTQTSAPPSVPIHYQVAQQSPPSLRIQQQQSPQQTQQQTQQQPVPVSTRDNLQRQQTLTSYSSSSYHQQHSNSPLYFGHNPFIEILRPQSYADDNIVTLNLSHSHIYEIDSDAFLGQRFEHIDLSNNKLGLIHSRSFRIGPQHSRHNPYNPHGNTSKPNGGVYPTRRPPPAHPKSVTIDFSHNPAIVALSGAFDHIDVPNCLLNFTNSTVELKFGAFKKYFKEHPGHIIDIESVDCCEQEWLLGYKHNFVPKTHCDHDPNLFLTKVPQQQIIDSCIAYVTSARHSMTIQGPSIIHQVAALPRSHSSSHTDNQYTTYLILGGTAMILTSLSIYIIFYMFSLKAAFVYQMQNKS